MVERRGEGTLTSPLHGRGTGFFSRLAGQFARKPFAVGQIAQLDSLISSVPPREFVARLQEVRHSLRRSADRYEEKLSALRLINLVTAKWHYHHRHSVLLSRPIGFMMDPANGCNLGCPGCWNSKNTSYAEAAYNPMQRGVMKKETLDAFLADGGFLSFNAHLYNYSEPLLNKQLPDVIRRFTRLRMQTLVSTNLSLPKIDAEALVESGLTTLMVAIDGVSQGVYEQYRRGGDVEIIFSNLRKIVEAKKRLGRSTPYIRWQYLLFAHNGDEVDRAFELAEEIGVDLVNVSPGYPEAAAGDEPTFSAAPAVHWRAGTEHAVKAFQPAPVVRFDDPLDDDVCAMIDAELKRNLRAEFVDNDARTADYCDWLYVSTMVDAMGKVTPCCIPDLKSFGDTFNFGNVHAEGNFYNLPSYVAARQATAGIDPVRQVACATCKGRPPVQCGLRALQDYREFTAGVPYHDALSDSLVHWSQHKTSLA